MCNISSALPCTWYFPRLYVTLGRRRKIDLINIIHTSQMQYDYHSSMRGFLPGYAQAAGYRFSGAFQVLPRVFCAYFLVQPTGYSAGTPGSVYAHSPQAFSRTGRTFPQPLTPHSAFGRRRAASFSVRP
jgi:hypothetical protein